MPFLLGSFGLLAFGLVYVLWHAFSAPGVSPDHALVGLLALFGAALLPCLAHTLQVWERVRSQTQLSDPALLAMRRDLDLLFRTQEEHAQRVQLSLARLESELTPARIATPDPSPAIAALEETLRQHLTQRATTDTTFRQTLVRLDTSLKHLNKRVEQLELQFNDSPAVPEEDIFHQNLSSASSSSPSPSNPITNPSASTSPLLSRALASSSSTSGHVSRLIAGGMKQSIEKNEVSDS